MNRKNIATAFASLFVMCLTSAAKSPDVGGTVVDAQGQPIPFANVILMSLPDSTFLHGSTADLNGQFNIVADTNKGLLKVTSVGYETQFVNVADFNGRVTMKEESQVLSEITVKGQRPKTKLTGNSMVTGIQGTVLEKSGTAKEMLSKVPGMTQRGDDLEVIGKGSPIYYINGRRMQDADELKRLRSEEIKEVEVVTNPGAQYDATVNAVVRIRTIRRQGEGFGFDVNLDSNSDLRYGYYDPSATTNLRYRHNDVEVFGMLNYWKWNSIVDTDISQWSHFGTGSNLQHIEQLIKLRNEGEAQGLNYNLGFDWQIADMHSVGMRIERHDRLDTNSELKQETLLKQWKEGLESNAVTGNNHSTQKSKDYMPYNWNGNTYYNGRFGKLGIDLNIDFLTNKSSDETTVNDITNGTEQRNMFSKSRTSNYMIADKLVLSYPVWNGIFNIGTEMSFVTRKSRYAIDGLDLPTTDSKVQENNIAAFTEYACMIPKIGSLSAGLRYEHVGFDYIDRLDATKSMDRYTDDIFPSISWANQWGSWQTALSYSIKTVRPNYSMLNEAVTYINSYSLQGGDPKLKNAKKQEIGATLRWKYLTLMASYERIDDMLSQWSYLYNDNGVILIKNINLDVPVRSFSLYANASPTWGCYTPNWTAGMQNFFLKQTLADPRETTGERIVRYNKPLFFLSANNAFRFKHSWQLECNASIISKGDVMNYRLVKPTYTVNFVVQKCWLKNDALCLRASINDILQRSGQKIEMDCGYYTLIQNANQGNHRLDISLRYSFNAAKSKYKGTSAGKEAVDRMGTSSK